MIKLVNPRGWQGVEAILTRFTSELLRQKLGQYVIVAPRESQSIAMRVMALIKKDKRHNHGYLLKVIAGLDEITIEFEDLNQTYKLTADFAEQTLPVVLRTISQLLVNHHQSSA